MDSTTEDTDFSSCEGNHKQDSYKCPMDDCKASFKKKSKLLFHIRVHVGERPYACTEDGCKKTYTNSSHLRRHKASVHTKLPKVKCTHPGCIMEFYNGTNMKRHIARKHNPNRKYPYKCEICDEGFSKKKHLQKHLYVHTGVKGFECPTCATKFITLVDVNRHARTHQTYTCDVCSETFQRYTAMLKHKREKHKTDHACDECDKSFASKDSLRQHKKWVHMGVKEVTIYSCPRDGCGKTYMYKRNLNMHIRRVHDNVPAKKTKKEFPCPHDGCSAVLTRKQYLNSHMKIHVRGKVERKQRKDAGIPRISIVSELAAEQLTHEQNQKQLDSDSDTDDSAIEHELSDYLGQSESGEEPDLSVIESEEDADSESEQKDVVANKSDKERLHVIESLVIKQKPDGNV